MLNLNEIASSISLLPHDVDNSNNLWYSEYNGSYWQITKLNKINDTEWERSGVAITPLSTDNLTDNYDNSSEGQGCFCPSLITVDDSYWMYYTGYSTDNIFTICLAKSSDLDLWIKNGPVLEGDNSIGSYTSGGVLHPYVIKVSDTDFRMYLVGYDKYKTRILYSTSLDGESWSTPILLFEPNNSSSFDYISVYRPIGILNPENGVNTRIIYIGFDGLEYSVGYTDSLLDPITFDQPRIPMQVTGQGINSNMFFSVWWQEGTQIDIDPDISDIYISFYDVNNNKLLIFQDSTNITEGILTPLDTNNIVDLDIEQIPNDVPHEYFDWVGVNDPCVLHVPQSIFGYEWLMFYAGNDNTAWRIGVATLFGEEVVKLDGPLIGKSIIDIQPSLSTGLKNVTSPSVIYDENDTSYPLKMLFSGETNNGWVIFGAKSSDGLNWISVKLDNDNPKMILPILEAGDDGKFDEEGLKDPCLMQLDDNTYVMWYVGLSGNLSRLGYATSTNFETWVKYEGDETGGSIVDIGLPNTNDHGGVCTPMVSQAEDGTYGLFYLGRSNKDRFLYAESLDRVTWEKKYTVLASSSSDTPAKMISSPYYLAERGMLFFSSYDGEHWSFSVAEMSDILTTQTWELYEGNQQYKCILDVIQPTDTSRLNSWINGCIIYNQNDPNTDELFTGWLTNMNFNRNGDSINSILSLKVATSIDGYNWNLKLDDTGQPITCQFSNQNAFNINKLTSVNIIINDSSVPSYEMWFCVDGVVYYATSTDKINWDNNSTPVLESIFSAEHSGIYQVSVIKEATDSYKMWYSDNDGEYKIYYTTSTDGQTWDTSIEVLTPSGIPEMFDEYGVFSPSVIYHSEFQKYWMLYTGITDNKYSCGIVSSSDGQIWSKIDGRFDNKAIIKNTGLEGRFDNYFVTNSSIINVNNEDIFAYYFGMTDVFRLGVATFLRQNIWEVTVPTLAIHERNPLDAVPPDGGYPTLEQLTDPVLQYTGLFDSEGIPGVSVIYNDGYFECWYIGYDGIDYKIGYAIISTTGNIMKYGPVFDSGFDTRYGKAFTIYSLHVIKPTDDKYLMYFTILLPDKDGNPDPLQAKLFCAESKNGKKWENIYEILQETRSPNDFDFHSCGNAFVMYDEDETDDKKRYKMWYSGLNNNRGGRYMIFYATSPDGLNWFPYKQFDESVNQEVIYPIIFHTDLNGHLLSCNVIKTKSSWHYTFIYVDPEVNCNVFSYTSTLVLNEIDYTNIVFPILDIELINFKIIEYNNVFFMVGVDSRCMIEPKIIVLTSTDLIHWTNGGNLISGGTTAERRYASYEDEVGGMAITDIQVKKPNPSILYDYQFTQVCTLNISTYQESTIESEHNLFERFEHKIPLWGSIYLNGHAEIYYTEIDLSSGNMTMPLQKVISIGSESDRLQAFGPHIVFVDGTYHMFYSGFDGVKCVIIHTTSTDGITWLNKQVILTPSEDYDALHVYNPCVLFSSDSGCTMIYTGHDGLHTKLCGAVSDPSLSNWSKTGILVNVGEDGRFDSRFLKSPEIYFQDNGSPIMLYVGYSDAHYRIGGVELQGNEIVKYGVVLDLGGFDAPDNVHTYSPSLYKKDYMIYVGSDGEKEYLCGATTSDGKLWTRNKKLLTIGPLQVTDKTGYIEKTKVFTETNDNIESTLYLNSLPGPAGLPEINANENLIPEVVINDDGQLVPDDANNPETPTPNPSDSKYDRADEVSHQVLEFKNELHCYYISIDNFDNYKANLMHMKTTDQGETWEKDFCILECMNMFDSGKLVDFYVLNYFEHKLFLYLTVEYSDHTKIYRYVSTNGYDFTMYDPETGYFIKFDFIHSNPSNMTSVNLFGTTRYLSGKHDAKVIGFGYYIPSTSIKMDFCVIRYIVDTYDNTGPHTDLSLVTCKNKSFLTDPITTPLTIDDFEPFKYFVTTEAHGHYGMPFCILNIYEGFLTLEVISVYRYDNINTELYELSSYMIGKANDLGAEYQNDRILLECNLRTSFTIDGSFVDFYPIQSETPYYMPKLSFSRGGCEIEGYVYSTIYPGSKITIGEEVYENLRGLIRSRYQFNPDNNSSQWTFSNTVDSFKIYNSDILNYDKIQDTGKVPSPSKGTNTGSPLKQSNLPIGEIPSDPNMIQPNFVTFGEYDNSGMSQFKMLYNHVFTGFTGVYISNPLNNENQISIAYAPSPINTNFNETASLLTDWFKLGARYLSGSRKFLYRGQVFNNQLIPKVIALDMTVTEGNIFTVYFLQHEFDEDGNLKQQALYYLRLDGGNYISQYPTIITVFQETHPTVYTDIAVGIRNDGKTIVLYKSEDNKIYTAPLGSDVLNEILTNLTSTSDILYLSSIGTYDPISYETNFDNFFVGTKTDNKHQTKIIEVHVDREIIKNYDSNFISPFVNENARFSLVQNTNVTREKQQTYLGGIGYPSNTEVTESITYFVRNLSNSILGIESFSYEPTLGKIINTTDPTEEEQYNPSLTPIDEYIPSPAFQIPPPYHITHHEGNRKIIDSAIIGTSDDNLKVWFLDSNSLSSQVRFRNTHIFSEELFREDVSIVGISVTPITTGYAMWVECLIINQDGQEESAIYYVPMNSETELQVSLISQPVLVVPRSKVVISPTIIGPNELPDIDILTPLRNSGKYFILLSYVFFENEQYFVQSQIYTMEDNGFLVPTNINYVSPGHSEPIINYSAVKNHKYGIVVIYYTREFDGSKHRYVLDMGEEFIVYGSIYDTKSFTKFHTLVYDDNTEHTFLIDTNF